VVAAAVVEAEAAHQGAEDEVEDEVSAFELSSFQLSFKSQWLAWVAVQNIEAFIFCSMRL
jgi:hypothetical protein